MSRVDLQTELERCRADLVSDTLPFWLKHGLDPEHGGILTALARDGSMIDSDKSVWCQGRCAWMFATLYNTVEAREEWLSAALSCLDFLERHAFDTDGRMFFLLTRDGRALRKRRYAYSEAFACMAYAACARAAGREDWAKRSRELFDSFRGVFFEPGVMEPKSDPVTRPSKSLGPLMIGLHLAQVLRDCEGGDRDAAWIDRCIDEIERDFCKAKHGAVMETVSPAGELLDHFDGRLLNPGHAIETAWFILHEARQRAGDPRLVELGVRMLDWMWERGWDEEFGGLFSFCDLDGLPPQEPVHQMKYWWPHNEAIIATLLAYQLTGEERHAQRFQEVHAWAHDHFADPEHGEWFGYLNRDGTRSTDLKGNHWKGPFHLPRMQWYVAGLAPTAE